MMLGDPGPAQRILHQGEKYSVGRPPRIIAKERPDGLALLGLGTAEEGLTYAFEGGKQVRPLPAEASNRCNIAQLFPPVNM